MWIRVLLDTGAQYRRSIYACKNASRLLGLAGTMHSAAGSAPMFLLKRIACHANADNRDEKVDPELV